jgi:hypothetical protein
MHYKLQEQQPENWGQFMKSLLLVLALISFNSFAAELGESKSPEKCEFSKQTVKRDAKESDQKVEPKKSEEKPAATRA